MEMRHVRFGVQSRMNPHRPQHSLGLILNALHSSLRDERGFSSQLLSMHSKSSALAGTWVSPFQTEDSPVSTSNSLTNWVGSRCEVHRDGLNGKCADTDGLSDTRHPG